MKGVYSQNTNRSVFNHESETIATFSLLKDDLQLSVDMFSHAVVDDLQRSATAFNLSLYTWSQAKTSRYL